ncbi:MAG: hypothetical protein ABI665_12715 [Vicinamibacterales bacterium]
MVCVTQASIADAQCVDGRDFQTVDYFAPPQSMNQAYVDQGGYHNSLCNDPHTLGPNGANNGPCHRIDLKGYLYLPPPATTIGDVIGDVSGTGLVTTGFDGPIVSGALVRTTDHDLPLVIFVEGSWSNPDPAHPEIPNPTPYPFSCAMGRFFTSRGYAFLAIVRRGYFPSTGTNEIVQFAPANDPSTGRTKHKRVLDYLANESFEVQEALTYMINLDSLSGEPVIDYRKIGLMGHSYGGFVTLFYGDANNTGPLFDAGNIFVFPKTKTIIAAASESWDGFDTESGAQGQGGALDDQSASIRQLKVAARSSPFPTYFLEPKNDVNTRPTTVLSRAMANFNLATNRACRLQVYSDPRPYPHPNGAIDAESDIALRCSEANGKLAGLEYQATIFPPVDIVGLGYPKITSAHGVFVMDARQVAVWAPTVEEFLGRYGVKP